MQYSCRPATDLPTAAGGIARGIVERRSWGQGEFEAASCTEAAVITIVPYDCRWPERFVAEAARIEEAMAGAALRVEHVGSTAVPGLAAKPVIDIQVSVASLGNLDLHAGPLARLGYVHVPLGAVDLDYPFFQKPSAWPTTHHIHLCVLASEHERRHLDFRDYLRTHPEVAAEYAAMKRDLAAQHGGETFESRELYRFRSRRSCVPSCTAHAGYVSPDRPRIAAGNAAHYPAIPWPSGPEREPGNRGQPLHIRRGELPCDD